MFRNIKYLLNQINLKLVIMIKLVWWGHFPMTTDGDNI